MEKGRYLTDQEKFDIVALNIVEGRAISYTKNDTIEEYSYSSVAEFYAMNPNCFKFVDKVEIPDGPYTEIPYYAKYHGRLSTLIEATFIFGFDEQNDNKPIIKQKIYGLSNCGDFVKDPAYVVMKFMH